MFKKTALITSGLTIALATTALVLAGCSASQKEEHKCPPTYPISLFVGTVERWGDMGFKTRIYLKWKDKYQAMGSFIEPQYADVEKFASFVPCWMKRNTDKPNPDLNGEWYEWVSFGSYGKQNY